MKKQRTTYIYIILLAITFLLSAIVPEEAFARRGGGFRFGGSRSSSWGKSRSKSSWSSSKKKSLTSRRSSTKSISSKADRTLYKKAKTSGTVFKNRGEARKSFQSKFGDQYTSRFPSKPNQRPDYIPKTTRINGRNTPIDYNPAYGGYGYFGPGGNWIFYAVMADMVMSDRLMRRHSYYYGAPPGYGGFGRSLLNGMIIVGIIVVLAVMLRPK